MKYFYGAIFTSAIGIIEIFNKIYQYTVFKFLYYFSFFREISKINNVDSFM